MLFVCLEKSMLHLLHHLSVNKKSTELCNPKLSNTSRPSLHHNTPQHTTPHTTFHSPYLTSHRATQDDDDNDATTQDNNTATTATGAAAAKKDVEKRGWLLKKGVRT